MRLLNAILLTCLLSITFSIEAQAQLFDRLKNKAQKAAAQKVEEKLSDQVERATRQMVEDSWNTVFGDISADSAYAGGIPFAMNSNVKTEDAYNFDTVTSMEIKTIRKDGKSDPPVMMDMHFNKDEMYTGTRFTSEEMEKTNGNLFIIYDLENSAMIMLMENENKKVSFAYEWKQALENMEPKPETSQGEEEVNWDEVEEWRGYSKIGSKNIQGYECDGYRSETSEGVIEIWVSRDEAFGMNNMFKANSNARQMKGKIPENYPSGMIMEMVSEDLESGDKTIMKVIDIEKNAQITYAMSDYPTMSFGAKK